MGILGNKIWYDQLVLREQLQGGRKGFVKSFAFNRLVERREPRYLTMKVDAELSQFVLGKTGKEIAQSEQRLLGE